MKEVTSEECFDKSRENEQLRRLLSKLPNLSTLQVTAMADQKELVNRHQIIDIEIDRKYHRALGKPFHLCHESRLVPTSFLSRRTGLPQSHLAMTPWAADNFENLLPAAARARIPIKYLRISLDNLETFAKLVDLGPKPILRNTLCGLHRLDLRIWNRWLAKGGWVPRASFKQSARGLGHVLDGAKNLTSLSLNFGPLPDESVSAQDELISSEYHRHAAYVCNIVPKLNFPNLYDLQLVGLVASEKYFIEFFSLHSKVLRVLRLGHVRLAGRWVGDGDGIYSAGASILSLLDGLQARLRLESITLSWNFSNRVDEEWIVPEADGGAENSLRRQIERFICHKGPSPFGGLEQYLRGWDRDAPQSGETAFSQRSVSPGDHEELEPPGSTQEDPSVSRTPTSPESPEGDIVGEASPPSSERGEEDLDDDDDDDDRDSNGSNISDVESDSGPDSDSEDDDLSSSEDEDDFDEDDAVITDSGGSLLGYKGKTLQSRLFGPHPDFSDRSWVLHHPLLRMMHD